MHRVSLRSVLAVALAPWPAIAGAEVWTGLAIGNPGPGAESAFADAFYAAEGLKAAGVAAVTLEREVSADRMLRAVETVAGSPAIVLYLAAPLTPGADGPVIGAGRGAAGPDDRLALGAVLRSFAEAGTRRVAVLVEDCGGPEGQAGRVALPPVPEGLELFLAASAGPQGGCEGAARLTDTLRAADGPLALDEALAGGWIGARMTSSVDLGATGGTTVAAASSPSGTQAVEAQSPVVTIVEPGPATAVSAVAPVSQAETVVPAASPAGQAAAGDSGVALFVAPPASQLAALPTAEGLPEPSIIVGIIENTAASFETVEEDAGEVTSNEIAFDNLEARRAFKAQDPQLFQALVDSGAFDPPDVELPRVLQAELARMGCYRAAIDGDWGNGSRAAVDRYFAELDGVEPVTREATVELWRQVILRDDVACPEVEPAVATQPRSSGGTVARQQPAAAQQPRQVQQQPARQPAAQQPQRTIRNNTLGGVFR